MEFTANATPEVSRRLTKLIAAGNYGDFTTLFSTALAVLEFIVDFDREHPGSQVVLRAPDGTETIMDGWRNDNGADQG